MQRPGTGPQLPSIHTLHPYLPPPLASAQYPPPSSNPSNAPPASSYAGSDPEERDAEPEEDPEEPPKKKRRRQALSCTECKRRKIRSEKYVPRAEHDALLARVVALETYLQRIPPPVLGALPAFSPSYRSESSTGSNSAHENASPPRFLNPPNTINPSHLGHGNTFAFNPVDSPPPMDELMAFSPQRTSPPQTLASTSTSTRPQPQHRDARPRTSSGASFSQLQTRSISPYQTRRSPPDVLASPSTHHTQMQPLQTQTPHQGQQQRRASFSQPAHQHARPRASSSASFSQPSHQHARPRTSSSVSFSHLQTRANSPHQTRRSPPQILALEPASTSTQQERQRRASFSPHDLTPTSTQAWGVGGGEGFGVFPAASGASGSATYFSAPPGSGSGSGPGGASSSSGGAYTPASSGSFSSFSASPGGSSSYSSSSSGSRSSGYTSSFSSSGASATPVPLMSSEPAVSALTPGAQMRAKRRIHEIYDSPILLAPTVSVNTSVEGPEPKNRPAQAPQGARLRAGYAPWAGVGVAVVGCMPEALMPGLAGRGATNITTSHGAGASSARLLLDVSMHPSPPLRARMYGQAERAHEHLRESEMHEEGTAHHSPVYYQRPPSPSRDVASPSPIDVSPAPDLLFLRALVHPPGAGIGAGRASFDDAAHNTPRRPISATHDSLLTNTT
ncbi:hypothetical protein C8R44DRAFT_881059 [Mycena epipterygia]|nr:hypothetical protein C8R44DRAFT_881059 [Mycena epipterygia]